MVNIRQYDDSERKIYYYRLNISTDLNDDLEMCSLDFFREEAVEEIEKVKNTGDLKKIQHLLDMLKDADEKFNVKKESIKKVFKDDSGVMESIENIEKEIKKTNYKILKDIM